MKPFTFTLPADEPVQVATHSTDHGGGSPAHPVPGLSRGHSYSVLGYDATRDVVQLRDPRGTREPTTSDATAKDGHLDGLFELSMTDLCEYYLYVTIEEP